MSRCPTNIFSMKVALSFLNTVTNDSNMKTNYITLKNLVACFVLLLYNNSSCPTYCSYMIYQYTACTSINSLYVNGSTWQHHMYFYTMLTYTSLYYVRLYNNKSNIRNHPLRRERLLQNICYQNINITSIHIIGIFLIITNNSFEPLIAFDVSSSENSDSVFIPKTCL